MQIRRGNNKHCRGAIETSSSGGVGKKASRKRRPGLACGGLQSFLKNVAVMVGLKSVNTSAGKNILSIISNKYSWFLPVEII
jgi:hypothetical protein